MANDKIRPRPERIASLAGMTTFRDIRDGFGAPSSVPPLQSTEVAAALALCRARKGDVGFARDDIGPEVLETYYGSTQAHRRALVSAFLAVRTHVAAEHMAALRLATTVAAQIVAGVEISRERQSEFAFIAVVRLETFRSYLSEAHGWFLEQHDNALPEFLRVLRAIVDGRLMRYLAERQARHDAVQAEIRQRRERTQADAQAG